MPNTAPFLDLGLDMGRFAHTNSKIDRKIDRCLLLAQNSNLSQKRSIGDTLNLASWNREQKLALDDVKHDP